MCYFQHNLYRHTWIFTRFTNERILHLWFKNIYNVLCMLWWSQGILKANFCTTLCGYMHFQIPPCSTLRWKIRAFHLLLHLWSREGGIIAAFHPKVEFFHLFQLQCTVNHAFSRSHSLESVCSLHSTVMIVICKLVNMR